MTKLQKIQLRQSEVRSRVRGLLDVETRDDSQDRMLADLTGEATTLETELRAALATDDTERRTVETPDAEYRERMQIRAKCGISDYLRAAATGSEVTGAAGEFSAAYGVPTYAKMPTAMLDEPEIERRAITPGPAVDGPAMPAVPFLFQRTAAAQILGVQFRTVTAGQVQIPKITVAPPVAAVAKDGAAPVTAGTITLVTRSAKRLSGQLQIRVEDMAIYPPLEDELRLSLQSQIGNVMDDQAIAGNGSGANLTGLFKTAADVSAAAAVETYATGIARLGALVDGENAYSLSDVRVLVGSATFGAFLGLFASNGSIPLWDYLSNSLGAIRASNRVPAVSGNSQKGICVLSGSTDPIAIYVWNSMDLTRDPFSGAGSGTVTVTATSLLSDIHVPHGAAQVKEIHPKLS